MPPSKNILKNKNSNVIIGEGQHRYQAKNLVAPQNEKNGLHCFAPLDLLI